VTIWVLNGETAQKCGCISALGEGIIIVEWVSVSGHELLFRESDDLNSQFNLAGFDELFVIFLLSHDIHFLPEDDDLKFLRQVGWSIELRFAMGQDPGPWASRRRHAPTLTRSKCRIFANGGSSYRDEVMRWCVRLAP
jgi:hypothetical protein